MNKYWFFLSYARNDANGYPHLNQFYEDLTREVRRMAPLDANTSSSDIAFLDQSDIQTGDQWLRTLTEAIQTSRTLVCIYSRGYFNSEFCGKEFAGFQSRIDDYVSTNHSIDTAPLIIPVLWDQPGRLPQPMPEAVRAIQYTHDEFGELYAKEGLLYIMRLQQHRDDYQRFLVRFADKVVQVAKAHELPRLTSLDSLEQLESSFNATQSNLLIEEGANLQGQGPNVAQFVFVAGTHAEFAGVRLGTQCYGANGGREWQPYYPQDKRAVGIMSQAAATSQNLQYETLAIDQHLVNKLRRAEETNTIVVIVVDPWSIQVRSYEQPMMSIDKRSFLNCGVLIPWNENDDETSKCLHRLKTGVERTFSRLLILNTSYFRDSVNSADALQKELADTLIEVRRRLLLKAKVLRPIEHSGIAIPEISGPDGAGV